MKQYDIRLKATIEIGGIFEAENRDVAVEIAKQELRLAGELSDVTVERSIYLPDEG